MYKVINPMQMYQLIVTVVFQTSSNLEINYISWAILRVFYDYYKLGLYRDLQNL